MANTLTADDLQDEAQEVENGAAFVYHVDPVAGDNTQLGKCWRGTSDGPKKDISAVITHAAANFANKFIGIRFNGPVALGTGFLNFQTANLGPGVLRGIGRYSAITGARANAPSIWAGSNWEYADFRIISAAGADTYNYLIGDVGNNITGVKMNRLVMEGTTDGPYFTGTNSEYDVLDSLIKANWDLFYNQGSGIIARYRRCNMFSLGPHLISSAAHVQGAGQSVNGAITYLNDCNISFRATNSDSARVAYGVHTQNGGIIELHRTNLICKIPDGVVVDLEADNGSEIIVGEDCSYNYARSLLATGTITRIRPYAVNTHDARIGDVSWSNDSAVQLIPAPLPLGLFGASVEIAASFASSIGGVLVPITVFQNTNTPLAFKIVDGLKNPVNLTGHTLNFLIHDPASSTATFTIACTLSQSDPAGAPTIFDTVNVTVPKTDVANSGNFAYKVRDTTVDRIYAAGPFNVKVSP